MALILTLLFSTVSACATAQTAAMTMTGKAFVQKSASDAKLITAGDDVAAVKMVIDGKAHAFVADRPVCAVSVFRCPNQQLTTLKKPLTFAPIGIAIQAGEPLLMTWLQNFLVTLQAASWNPSKSVT